MYELADEQIYPVSREVLSSLPELEFSSESCRVAPQFDDRFRNLWWELPRKFSLNNTRAHDDVSPIY